MATKKRAKKSAAKPAKKGAKKASAKSANKGAKKASAKKASAKITSAKKASARKPAKKPPKPAKQPTDTAVVIDVVEVAFSDVESGPQVDGSNAETEAAQFLKDYDDGNIDN